MLTAKNKRVFEALAEQNEAPIEQFADHIFDIQSRSKSDPAIDRDARIRARRQAREEKLREAEREVEREVAAEKKLLEYVPGLDAYDLLRPPGFVGEVCDWINSQCLYPRHHLAVAAALTAVGNAGGLRHADALQPSGTANLFAFCIAPSGTGKEAIRQAVHVLLKAAGVIGAVHGTFKSEQEVIRNLIRNQAAYYVVDEIGIMLKKVVNSSKSGASYLEGLIGLLMSVYSSTNGVMPISGDVKEEIRSALMKELTQVSNLIDATGQTPALDQRKSLIEESLNKIDDGLVNPFLSVLGFTTPVTFDGLATFESATNGFFSRSLLFYERDSNPRWKEDFSAPPLPEHLAQRMANLYYGGNFDVTRDPHGKVHCVGEKKTITTTQEAIEKLKEAHEYFYDMATKAQADTGLEAIPRRGYEMIVKISFILALEGGVRTIEHVEWAFALIREEVQNKMHLTCSEIYKNSRDPATQINAHKSKILYHIGRSGSPVSIKVLYNRCHNIPMNILSSILEDFVAEGIVIKKRYVHKRNGTLVENYSTSPEDKAVRL